MIKTINTKNGLIYFESEQTLSAKEIYILKKSIKEAFDILNTSFSKLSEQEISDKIFSEIFGENDPKNVLSLLSNSIDKTKKLLFNRKQCFIDDNAQEKPYTS